MTKDKLAALQAAQDDSEPEDAYDIPDSDPMEAFFNEVQTIREMLTRIETCVKEVKELHSALLTAPQTDPKQTQRLEDLTAEIKQTANRARSKLKEIEPEDEDSSKAETRMRMTQHMTLSKKMVEIMTEYNKAQVDYSDRCKARLKRQLEIAGKPTTDDDLDKMLDEGGNVSVFTGDIMTETRQEKQRLADIEARHADLIKLEKSIKELHDMFLDMAMLVENQGELLDRIEYQVGLTRDKVDDATKDLKKASQYQAAARKKKLMIIGCLTIAAIVGISIVVGWVYPSAL